MAGLFLPDINETLKGAYPGGVVDLDASDRDNRHASTTSELTGAMKDLTTELKKDSGNAKMVEVLGRLAKAISEGSNVTVTIEDNRVDEQTRKAAGSTDPSDYSGAPSDYSNLRNTYGSSR